MCSQALAVGLLLSTICVAAETPKLAAALAPLVETHRGQIAVAVEHLLNKQTYTYRADEPMPTASLIKFPVMVEAYRQAVMGKMPLSTKVKLREQDKVPGSGILTTHFSPGTEITFRDAVRLMIAYSDNTATNMVLDQIELKSVNQTMHRLGLARTRIHSKVFRRASAIDREASRQFGLGVTTAAETLRLYRMLYRRELVSGDACREMREHLGASTERDKLAMLLPSNARVEHKGGSITASRCDAGILETPGGPVAVCVLTSQNEDRSWDDDNEAELLIARIGKAVWDVFDTSDAHPTQSPTVLAIGATGELVEALQRTLNARLKPSPRLAVDGDFGARTEQAVIQFQQSQSVKPNGIVGQTTWSRLGSLLTTAQPTRPPEIVNSEQLTREPPDGVAGPPFVTCRSWLIADAQSGAVLWSQQPDRILDIASTTKIMTALLVLHHGQQHPDVWNEMVEFSRQADQTRGSTAGIRAGERISVRELLYGLLLPSGNDAAVALAQHFGQRLVEAHTSQPDTQAVMATSVDQFVAAMNRMAHDLEMRNTTFRNPHGLTAPGHASTARDLAILARAALGYPRFGAYVSCRQRGCRVESVDGYHRNVVWKNTNRLLAIEGYDGVKTGTTSGAGACLVSKSRRGGRALILIVLGSRSS
ncbi:MAG: serine hydrolase, partial [Planctomycetaceae bacterium]